jgi:hypothetical protein
LILLLHELAPVGVPAADALGVELAADLIEPVRRLEELARRFGLKLERELQLPG